MGRQCEECARGWSCETGHHSIIAANNHYAGFGPGTANIFRNMLGLADAKWENMEIKEEKQEQEHPLHHDMKQRSISDFIS